MYGFIFISYLKLFHLALHLLLILQGLSVNDSFCYFLRLDDGLDSNNFDEKEEKQIHLSKSMSCGTFIVIAVCSRSQFGRWVVAFKFIFKFKLRFWFLNIFKF